jgi:hypothetical protein
MFWINNVAVKNYAVVCVAHQTHERSDTNGIEGKQKKKRPARREE